MPHSSGSSSSTSSSTTSLEPDHGRGHYTIFLGMAAGVGKTYRMLQEGHAQADARARRRDRPARDPRAGGDRRAGRRARVAPPAPGRRTAARRSTRSTCRRSCGAIPTWCLIDELAHTNAPGLEHAKRYEDIEDVLEAGIDVLSTVNVQHLESLNDQIAELSGVRVRETVPDSVLGRADEVVLIDLHAGGADRAPARRQDLPGGARSRRRSTASSGSRTCRRCARSRCVRWQSRSRPSG